MKYENDIENAINKKFQTSADIFDFRDTPKEQLFEKFYMFCREHLDNLSQDLNIDSTIFTFLNGFSSNAIAIRKNENDFGIFINFGLIKYCSDNFLDNENLHPFVDKNFPGLVEYFDVDIAQLAFQIATQFTYYHELAHLIQFSKKAKDLSLQEHTGECKGYSEIEHALEINADSFASIAISSHIQQFIEKSFGEKTNQENVEETVIILCACLLNYITSFYDKLDQIYFEEHCHPHPILRLFNVILNITHNLNSGKYLKKKKITIDTKELTKSVFNFYEVLEAKKIFNTNFSNSLISAFGVRKEIISHLNNLRDYNTTDFYDSLEKWNEHIT